MRKFALIVALTLSTCAASAAAPTSASTGIAPQGPSPFAYHIQRLPALATSAHWLSAAANAGVSHINLVAAPDWVFPIYRTTTADPLYSVKLRSGLTFRLRIPRGATPMAGSDGAMIVYQPVADACGGCAYELFRAVYHRGTHTWTAGDLSRTKNGSKWCNYLLPCGNPFNIRHRGVPPQIMAAENVDLAAGAINHALEVYWYQTATSQVFPMTGHEPGKAGVVPEGTFLRLKTDAATQKLVNGLSPKAKVIATALQRYGAMVADNTGQSESAIKLQRGYSGLNNKSLASIPLTKAHWDFVNIPPRCC